jgi:hypothetical protein
MRSHTGRSRKVVHSLHNTVMLLCLVIIIIIITHFLLVSLPADSTSQHAITQIGRPHKCNSHEKPKNNIRSTQDRSMYVYTNIEGRSRNHCSRRKVANITYFQYTCVALGVQHAKSVSRIIFSTVPCPALPHI